MIKSKDKFYNFIIYNAIENGNKNLLKLIPKNYLPPVSEGFDDIIYNIKQNNLHNLKYIELTSKESIDYKRYLLEVIKYNKIEIFEHLLKKINPTYFNNYNFLCSVVKHGCLEMLIKLKSLNIDIHLRNNNLLIKACYYGHLNIVEYFIDNGANRYIDECLKTACYNNHFNIVKYLILHNADIHVDNDTPIREACNFGNFDAVKFLVEHGADISVRNNISLIRSSSSGHFDIVKYLIKNGADVHAQNEESLYAAKFYGHYDIATYLIEHGAKDKEIEIHAPF